MRVVMQCETFEDLIERNSEISSHVPRNSKCPCRIWKAAGKGKGGTPHIKKWDFERKKSRSCSIRQEIVKRMGLVINFYRIDVICGNSDCIESDHFYVNWSAREAEYWRWNLETRNKNINWDKILGQHRGAPLRELVVTPKSDKQ